MLVLPVKYGTVAVYGHRNWHALFSYMKQMWLQFVTFKKNMNILNLLLNNMEIDLVPFDYQNGLSNANITMLGTILLRVEFINSSTLSDLTQMLLVFSVYLSIIYILYKMEVLLTEIKC